MGCVFEHGAEPGVLSNLSMVAMHTVLTMYGTEPKEVWPAEPGRPLTTQRLLHLQHLEPPDEDTDEPAGDNPGSRVFILGNGGHWICVRAVNGDEDFQEDRPDWVLHDNLERTSKMLSSAELDSLMRTKAYRFALWLRHGYRCAALPSRAAHSHSISEGRRLRAHLQ